MMLEIQNLSFSYRKPKMELFNNFSLNLEPGNIYGLLGKNGAGKSTLVYLLVGLLAPTAGQVLYNGINVRRRLPETLQDMFIISEEFSMPDLTFNQLVKLNAPFYPNFSHDDLCTYLDIFDMEPGMKLKSLSMGQKKKVFTSFALATNTRLLVMDEPTNGLDIPSKSQFRKVLAKSMSDEKIILISTHQVRDLDAILDHILIIDRNRLLLNAGVGDIAGRLSFKMKADGSQAIYAQSNINGQMVVEPNRGDEEETMVDLELLFNATLTNPQGIAQIFNEIK